MARRVWEPPVPPLEFPVKESSIAPPKPPGLPPPPTPYGPTLVPPGASRGQQRLPLHGQIPMPPSPPPGVPQNYGQPPTLPVAKPAAPIAPAGALPTFSQPPKPGSIPAPPSAPMPDLSNIQQAEMQMWQRWKETKKPEDLRPLIKSIQPLVADAVSTWRGRVKFVPDEAIEAEFKNHAIDAIRTYDPSKGAQLGTWVRSNLRKGGRFAKTYQNVGRVVEQRTDVIGDYNQTKAELSEMLGRPATQQEMLGALKTKRPDYRWSKPEIQRMESELRADILSSAFESDMNTFVPDLDDDIAAHLHEELSPDEQKVWAHIKDTSKTQGKTGLIAKELGWSDPKVSRMRKSIEAKAKELQRKLR